MVNQRDFRKLDPVTQAELRRVGVGMVQAGTTRIEAAAAVGVNRRFVGGVSPNPRKFRQIKFSPATIASKSMICPLSRKV
jgi:hypothetical protein